MKSLNIPASAIISASLLLASTPLYARDLVRSTETGKAIFKECWTLPGSQQGRCVNDVNKQWQREKHVFIEARNAKIKQWRLDHVHLGVSEEYRAAHAEFTKQMQAEWKVFMDELNRERKEFFALMEQNADSSASSSSSSRSSHTQAVDSEAEAAAIVKCSKIKDDRAQRICVRSQLRMNDPNATARGGASWRSRGQ